MDIIDTRTLKTLTVEGAKALMKENHEFLNLSGLTSLSDEVAEVLETGAGYLWLDGLSELSPRAAAALTRRKGVAMRYTKMKMNDLSLNGLTSISVETAEGLARCEGDLMLDGVTQLPDDVAAALAKFQGDKLELNGLIWISSNGLASLASSKGARLSMGLAHITVAQAKILEAFKGELGLRIKDLSADVAAILGARRGGLYLKSLTSLSVGAARGLANHNGGIDLCEVKQLTKEAAKALATVKGVVELRLETITLGVLAELAKRPEKSLNMRITTLSDSMAKALSRWPGHVSINDVKDLTERQVEILLPKYAAGELGRFRPGRKMSMALVKALNNGRWPFQASIGASSAALGEKWRGFEKSWRYAIDMRMFEIEGNIFDKNENSEGLSTGFQEIDQRLQGLQNSDLILLAGWPSVGKTTLALHIVEIIALGALKQAPRPVVVFSLETSCESVSRRMITRAARFSGQKFCGSEKISGAEYGKLKAAADTLRRAPICIVDHMNEVTEIRARARQLKREYDIQFIVVDYLQLVDCNEFKKDKYTETELLRERAAISQELKNMAKELKVPVLVVSQLNRPPDGRNAIPRISDLPCSGGIEQDADIVMIMRRPPRFKLSTVEDNKSKEEGEKDKAEGVRSVIVDIVKNPRGPVGEVNLKLEYGVE